MGTIWELYSKSAPTVWELYSKSVPEVWFEYGYSLFKAGKQLEFDTTAAKIIFGRNIGTLPYHTCQFSCMFTTQFLY